MLSKYWFSISVSRLLILKKYETFAVNNEIEEEDDDDGGKPPRTHGRATK